jgi:SAM-dependent methyltransferase
VRRSARPRSEPLTRPAVQADFAAEFLRCSACGRDRTLRLSASESDEREVREGVLRCIACRADFELHRGVGHLMPDPPAHVAREADGLARFAEAMRADGWDRELIRRLPSVEHGYWYVQARSMEQLLATVNLQTGQWLLDVGSNTCWASNHFAVRGLRVIALDISLTELQGLHTSDYFIEDGTSYFERVLGSMYDMPVASGSLDYVYCCEVLHHNDAASLRRTFKEAFRVLRPGGRMLIINETIKTHRDRIGVHTEGVEIFEGYEHAFWAARYRWEATRAGFLTRVLHPSYHEFFEKIPSEPPPLRRLRERARYELRASSTGRRAYLSWLNHVRGGVSLNMIATKPRVPARAMRTLKYPRRRLARFG